MQTVNVLYKYVDGAHFFVSGDEKTLGLCVADKDPIKAFEEVGSTLTTLFKRTMVRTPSSTQNCRCTHSSNGSYIAARKL